LLVSQRADSLAAVDVGAASQLEGGQNRRGVAPGATRVLVCALASVLLVAPRASRADDVPDAERIATARALGIEGVTLAEAGRCVEATDRLSRAEALHHAPTTLERLGECHVMLGHLVVGTEMLQRVVREPLATGAPAPFVAAHARAQTVLDKALPLIGTLRVHVEGAGPALEDVVVRIDGEPIAAAMLDVDRPTDPGDHAIEASAKGRAPASTTAKVAQGAHHTVTLTLDPAVAVPPPPPPPPTTGPLLPPPPPAGGEPTGGSSRWLGWTLGGVGVAGLAVGGVFGAKTFSDKSTLRNECTGNRCPSRASGDISTANTDAMVANVAFIGGAALVAGGIVLLLVHPSASAPAAAQGRITTSVGPGWAGLQGSF
jgi:hypothetical protein